MFRSQAKSDTTTLPDVSTKEQVKQLVTGATNAGSFSSLAVAEHVDSAAQSLGLDVGTRSAARTLLNSTRERESGASTA
ncbi:hypothetical protein EHS25_002096 [Saitozyma podzolica]|uniref:Uncharacterized protein n=1 Tax=Saitozyma podzolica TaxID=1890683 RepID=A0A427YEF1_9TREE|nr:hypothetical protein EHS25_002096 [Saitozyma podzolica]